VTEPEAISSIPSEDLGDTHPEESGHTARVSQSKAKTGQEAEQPGQKGGSSSTTKTNGKSAKRRWSFGSKPFAPKLVDEERYNAVRRQRARAQLVVDNVSVSFDGFKAIDALTLILDEGELRCIIGPNGAGKTTLMDIITAKTRPDEGHVFMIGEGDRRDLVHLAEHEVAELGIGRKFQRPTVFHGHTVFENLEMALSGGRGVFRSLFTTLTKQQNERIDEVLGTIGLAQRKNEKAGLLSHGQKQWLEIGMLLAQDPKVLLVDEPVAGMTHQEIDRTAELLNQLAGTRTVVVVEHDMDFVRSIATTVTVLHEGRILAEGPMDAIQNDPRVIEVYLGE
jgi:urea transport system ATP-binding protein